jgi:cell division septation protein DedD
MQVETAAHLACPLCKRQFLDSSEHASSTRLCQVCQAMVLTAFRGSNFSVPQSAVALPQTAATQPIQSDERAFDQGLVDAPAPIEFTPVEAITSEPQSRPPIPFDAPDPVRFDFYQEEDHGYKTAGSPADPPDARDGLATPTRMEVFEARVEESVAVERESLHVDERHLIGQRSAGSEVTVESNFDVAGVVADRLEHQSSSLENPGADEWQTAVATWDPDWDSGSEWPLLVAPAPERSVTKPRFAIAAVAAVAILASAVGFYFLIYRSSDLQERRDIDGVATTRASAVEPRAASVGSAVTATLAPAVQTQSESAAAAQPKPAEGQARDAAATDNSAQGQFSLQAASFPTQEGADEFAERLRRAGVPSYVVPAEVFRRGRWFRVRVGRFNSAEDAQRFAAEAQQRARAAGVAVPLIVCQYGQP